MASRCPKDALLGLDLGFMEQSSSQVIEAEKEVEQAICGSDLRWWFHRFLLGSLEAGLVYSDQRIAILGVRSPTEPFSL